ncbi:MAG TPA: GrpB family protein [Acetobacteraceae bacterium]|nr:GrpB family protein [Acetobacteraceae bacterium]
MPPPFKVELQPYDPRWPLMAAAEGRFLLAMLQPAGCAVEHVGSTAIPGMPAKPIIDLLPVVTGLGAFDQRSSIVEALGYRAWGEYGLPGRRYFTKDHPITGVRLVQLHCYALGSLEIRRHLAFRDYLRAHADVAGEYAKVKRRCQRAHPDDSHAYGDCKSGWIRRTEQAALAVYRDC